MEGGTATHVTTRIGEILHERVVGVGAAPGATAGVAWRSGQQWRWAVGCAGQTDPFDGGPVSADTWYDLASLTKSMTALVTARAVESGLLAWDDRLAKHLPFLGGTFGGDAPLLGLLSHRAGFVAHTLVSDSSIETLRALAETKREDLVSTNAGAAAPEPHPPLYSDVGYILVGLALQSRTGCALDELLQNELRSMAGDAAVWPNEVASARHFTQRGVEIASVAPTEVLAVRGGLIRGQVHDDNSWKMSETSTSGHAGMFGTARGVLGFGMLLLDLAAERSKALSQHSMETLLAPRRDGSLRAGFDSKNLRGPSVVGRVMGHRTFGHLGFTGTSYWCDPETETVIVLLTNRVCPSRNNLQLRAARPGVHDALALLARNLPG